MYRKTYVALACLGLLLGTAGCDTFLTGDKLSNNPNLPTAASAQQLFVGVQAGQFAFQEGAIAMIMCEWVQACSAGNSRFVQQAAQYSIIEATFDGDWISAYDGGGLLDIKNVEGLTGASGDSVWLGIAQIWEALTMGTVSSMWGDVPYSEAVSGKTNPVLDDRFVILGNLQTLLTTAIANLGKSGAGPGANDLVLGGDKAAWAKVAWTLKARYYMQTAESLTATGSTAAYTNAIAAALNGISDPTGASDFASFHTQATSERSIWAQFQTSSGFGTDLEGGKALIDILKARNDPRLAQYYCKATTAPWKASAKFPVNSAILDPNGNMEQVTAIAGDSSSGATQPAWPTTGGATTVDNNVTWINRGLPYVGDDYNTPPPPPVSQFNCLPPRFHADARIPYVSYVENELILAEAYNQTGNDALALTHLNNARATVPLGPLAGLTGAQLLDSIMIEKYAAMFQNIESINDYRRTCIPALVHSANSRAFQNVPGRLFYTLNERNVNPNVPTATVQLATHGFRNKGDVHACENDNSP